jgi:hypothetical protein
MSAANWDFVGRTLDAENEHVSGRASTGAGFAPDQATVANAIVNKIGTSLAEVRFRGALLDI